MKIIRRLRIKGFRAGRFKINKNSIESSHDTTYLLSFVSAILQACGITKITFYLSNTIMYELYIVTNVQMYMY